MSSQRRDRGPAATVRDEAGISPADFFISYTSADRPWAEWIAWALEDEGYHTILQAWDMQPGTNFVVQLDRATRVAERTIAVISPAFLRSRFCAPEWAAAIAKDPAGDGRKLIPIRVRECDVDGMLAQVVYIDVVGLDEKASRQALLAGVAVGRAKPTSVPAFPGVKHHARVRRPHQSGAAIFRVPVTTHTFVGRKHDLRRLADGFANDGRRVAQAVLGIGGVGKTFVVAQYARGRRDRYDVIWWLRCSHPQTLRSDFAELAAQLALPEAGAGDEQTVVEAVRTWLELNDRWLVVFDDAPDASAIASLLPGGSGGHVAITSRAHGDWSAIGARPLELGVWIRAESCAFLRARTGEEDDETLDAVAAALGDLPRAIERAAAYANTLRITLTRSLEILSEAGPGDLEHPASESFSPPVGAGPQQVDSSSSPTPGDITLSSGDLVELATTITEVFRHERDAATLLRRIEYPPARFPMNFSRDYRTAWDDVFANLAAGVLELPYRRTLDAALEVFPHNAALRAIAAAHTLQRVLVVGASLDGDNVTRADLELDAIRGGARKVAMSVHACSVRAAADLDAIMRYRPDILHVACDCDGQHLMFNGARGVATSIRASDLVQVLKEYRALLKMRIPGVVLSASDSASVAGAFGVVADTVIAYRGEVAEDCATRFAGRLYAALGGALPLAEAARIAAAEAASDDRHGGMTDNLVVRVGRR